MVTFLLYTSKLESFAREALHLRSLVLSYKARMLIMEDTEQLARMLTKLKDEMTVAVLLASSTEELEELVEIREHLHSIPSVLILPDERVQTLQMTMLLNPFYFTAKHECLRPLTLAIDELMQIYQNHLNPAQFFSLQGIPGTSSNYFN